MRGVGLSSGEVSAIMTPSPDAVTAASSNRSRSRSSPRILRSMAARSEGRRRINTPAEQSTIADAVNVKRVSECQLEVGSMRRAKTIPMQAANTATSEKTRRTGCDCRRECQNRTQGTEVAANQNIKSEAWEIIPLAQKAWDKMSMFNPEPAGGVRALGRGGVDPT